jgi:hypothetical protein
MDGREGRGDNPPAQDNVTGVGPTLTSLMVATGWPITIEAPDALPHGREGTGPLSRGPALDFSSGEAVGKDEREITSPRALEPAILK